MEIELFLKKKSNVNVYDFLKRGKLKEFKKKYLKMLIQEMCFNWVNKGVRR